MKKPIIAVDIDDVLAANAAGFIDFSNKTWGHAFQAGDYDENWTKLWGVDETEAERRSILFHESGAMSEYAHFREARTVLQRLAQQYTLVVVTSRGQLVANETHAWIAERFPDVFSEIYFAGLYDGGGSSAYSRTKADVLQKIKATYLIDDQLKHCIAAEACGVKALLFGNYPWNANAPKSLKRYVTWQKIGEYFYE